MIRIFWSSLVMVYFLLSLGPAEAKQRPNFLIIVADDLGWSDPGFLGSMIRTPNIDTLAKRGVFLSNFYVAPTCSPTRAMLLTGVSNHAAGLGTMHGLQSANQKGRIEYGAQLHDGVVTLAELLNANGYATAMSGKWHLGLNADQYPNRRGFERSFGLLQGGASHFSDVRQIHQTEEVTYLENGNPVQLPKDFYSTYSYTDKIIEYIRAAENKPFFAYLAYTAPHDPLQVPNDWLDRYAGVFDDGPAQAKTKRTKRLIEMGLLPEDAEFAEPQNLPTWLDGHKKPWWERSTIERKNDARRMEIYAAMVEIMDQQIGRVVKHLERSGKLDNTYILFMSDNGASAGTPYTYPANDRGWVDEHYDLDPAQMGKMGSFTTMGRDWTNVSNAPFRFFKATVGEGGVRSPLIVSGPGVKSGVIAKEPVHVMDIVPTISALAGIKAESQKIYKGKIKPAGRPIAALTGSPHLSVDRFLITELFGNQMVRRGKWKAVYLNPPLGSGEWELYNLDRDPSAKNNLATVHPELLDEMKREYTAFAKRNGVIEPDVILRPKLMALYEGPCDIWCRSKFAFADIMIDPTQRMFFMALVGVLIFLIGIAVLRKYRRMKLGSLLS